MSLYREVGKKHLSRFQVDLSWVLMESYDQLVIKSLNFFNVIAEILRILISNTVLIRWDTKIGNFIAILPRSHFSLPAFQLGCHNIYIYINKI